MIKQITEPMTAIALQQDFVHYRNNKCHASLFTQLLQITFRAEEFYISISHEPHVISEEVYFRSSQRSPIYHSTKEELPEPEIQCKDRGEDK